jgi:hypothetical protein
MTKLVRTLTATDKAYLALVLSNAGVKARIRKIHNGLRVVFEGSYEAIAPILNSEGFRHANGGQFSRFSFDGQQAFIRYIED